MTVVDIEEEKENSSGLIYILQTKRLARVLRENRSVEEPWEVELDDEVEEEEEDGRRRNLKSTFHSVGLGGEITSVDTSVTTSVTTVLHNIPLSLQMTEIKLGSLPLHTQCPHCTFFIVTKTEPEVGLAACLCSSLLCCLR